MAYAEYQTLFAEFLAGDHHLAPPQEQVARLIAEGKSLTEIGRTLSMHWMTAKSHVEAVARIVRRNAEWRANAAKMNWSPAERRAFLGQPIRELELSVCSYNCLMSANITTIRELVEKDETALRCIRHFDRNASREIKSTLASLGLQLGMRFDADGNPITPKT